MMFNIQAAQGDMLMIKVDALPADKDLKLMEVDNTNHYVIAHSETGHNHVISADVVECYREANTSDADLYELFMVVKETTELKHLRSFDTHKSITVGPGTYKVRRQREYTAEGFRRAAD